MNLPKLSRRKKKPDPGFHMQLFNQSLCLLMLTFLSAKGVVEQAIQRNQNLPHQPDIRSLVHEELTELARSLWKQIEFVTGSLGASSVRLAHCLWACAVIYITVQKLTAQKKVPQIDHHCKNIWCLWVCIFYMWISLKLKTVERSENIIKITSVVYLPLGKVLCIIYEMVH